MRLEDLGLIGNRQFSALIERTGEGVWCCLPRFDSEPGLEAAGFEALEFDGGIEGRSSGSHIGDVVEMVLSQKGPKTAVAYLGDDRTDLLRGLLAPRGCLSVRAFLKSGKGGRYLRTRLACSLSELRGS